MQSHMSGLTSGKVSNENGIKPQQNGDVQMPNSMGYPINKIHSNEHLRMRQKMQTEVFNVLQQRQPASSDNAKRAKLMDVARRLEEGLYKMAPSKEAYLDPQTLETRLGNLIKHYTQRRATSSSSVTRMIPTPGIPQGGNTNSMAMSTVDAPVIAGSGRNHIVTTGVSSESVLPASGSNGAFFSKSDGFPYGSRLKTSSSSSQRMTSQMIPTPGFSNNRADVNCQSQINLTTSTNTAGSSAVDSPVTPPSDQQRHHNARENNHAMQNTHMGNGFRSDLQQKSHGSENDSQLGGPGTNINNVQPANECRPAVSLSSSTHLQNSIKNLDLRQPRLQGEGNFVVNSGPYGSGNLDGTEESAQSMANTQNFNPVSLKSLPSGSSSFISNKSMSHEMQQVSLMKPQPANQSHNNSFSSSIIPARESIPQTHQPHQFPTKTHQFQNHQHFQQCQQEKIKQQPPLLNENTYAQPQLPSSVAAQVKTEPGVNHQTEVLLSQASQQFQSSKMQNRVQQSSAESYSGGALQASFSNDRHHIHPSLSLQSHMKQPTIHRPPLPLEPRNDCGGKSFRVQSEKVHDQHTQAQDLSHILENHTVQHGHENACQKPASQNEAQISELSAGACVIGSKTTTMSSDPANPSGGLSKSGIENPDLKSKARQRWLLLLHHARKCTAPEGKCQAPDCISVRKLLRHIDGCKIPRCTHPRCTNTKTLISHYNHCKDLACPVCVSVRSYLRQQARAYSQVRRNSGLLNPNAGSSTTSDHGVASGRLKVPSNADISDQQPPLKRLKVEPSSQSDALNSKSSLKSVSAETKVPSFNGVEHKDIKQNAPCVAVKSEAMEISTEMSSALGQAHPDLSRIQNIIENAKQRLDDDTVVHGEPVCTAKEVSMKLEKEVNQAKEEIATQSMEIMACSKSCKPKIKGVSLTELFTPEQVRKHICGLRQWIGQSKAKAEKNQALERSMTENSCQLCAVERLAFEPPPIYCTACGARVKRNALYYTVGNGEARQFICVPCYSEARGESVVVDGTHVPKARLEKKKHDEVTEEWWVQCDKCEGWQHQICALFNGRRNDGGQAEYTCANCYIKEVESGERKPLPQSAVLGAKDLPRTVLSDHIEQRLFKRLKQERHERARAKGKSYDEVPGAEPLVVRVVSSVDKKLEVKPLFLELFREENYPAEVPFKSKAVLLFQKIEGVEVCLFGMYVQEFGTDCKFPNQRRVYLSYLDSVKYFRPDVKTVTGEALRTFVYHEILIGYLEYCKKRGFTSCYIWACPPLKGEDYILYCHPEIQKTPRSDKLREWYLLMLEKAKNEKVVVEWTNLYDHFFTQRGECRAKVTAARLPYFDGDYWPGAAEDLICQMKQEDDSKKIIKKGTTKKLITKRAAKLPGPAHQSINMSKDRQLMQRLGETICPMKEDFIMVHLQHCCSHCCILMVSGNRWVCKQCDNFQICDKCHEAEQNREASERHPANQKEKHDFYPVVITDVPVDTEDKDEILESEFFDTRQAFLSLCQGNHYQYETLRRAKHSSMMILYHLHNPTAPAFVTTCNVCQLDIETGQGWRCEVCPDFDACNACYSKGINHPHKLTHHPSNADQDAQNKEARQQRVEQQRKMLDVLVHAAQCRSVNCSYVNCRKVKSLFRHGMQCKTRASGGCGLCKKMWYILQIHARTCKVSPCLVPRCRDLKEHWRRLQQQSDSRRRAAVMEMMRQRTAEIAGTSG